MSFSGSTSFFCFNWQPFSLCFVWLALFLTCSSFAQDQAPAPARQLPTVAELKAVPQDSWTMVVLPDTQYYVDHTRTIPPSPEVFQTMTQWIVANKAARNIQLVLHVGDIVDNDEPAEWKMAHEAMSVLNGELPYVISTGNHDYIENSKRRETKLNEFFKLSDNPLNSNSTTGIFRGSHQPNRLENAYYEFRSPNGDPWLIFSLEWGVRNEIFPWVDKILSRPEYANHRAILVTHAYLYHDDTLYDWEAKGKQQEGNPLSYGTAESGDNNDGRSIWNALVKKHKQFRFVFCGHVSGTMEERIFYGDQSEVGYLHSIGQSGNNVHQLLFNAQRRGDAGEGWLRLLEFQPKIRKVTVKTFSPWLESKKLQCWRTDADDFFSLTIE